MSNLRDRHAKILATIGPASSSFEMLDKLFIAGADAFRLNFSHGSAEEHIGRARRVELLEVIAEHPACGQAVETARHRAERNVGDRR